MTASYIFTAPGIHRLPRCSFPLPRWIFGSGRQIAKAKTDLRGACGWLPASAMNLSMLGFFKYGNFLLENFQWLLARIGIIYHPPHLDILLPVGISFYTFHSLSYTLDIYRGVLQPTKSLRDFVLAVSFFPQLVAGPIVRAGDFLPQLVRPPGLRIGQFLWGLLLMTLGLFEKIVLADTMLAGSADRIFGYAGPLVALDSWLGVIAFAGQIFFDFAGYSTCAIGAALCLGFHLKDNFRFPYAAIGFSDFWRRWHISLSTFLRDYLYIPLGGNRVGWTRAAINLVIVMFLGGLWHGAAWTFVVWGLLHGSYLVIEHASRALIGERAWTDNFAVKLLLGLVTYGAVCLAWVFFRASDFTIATRMLRGMFGGHPHGDAILATREMLQIGIVTFLHDACALVAARDQRRNGGDAFAALDCDHCLGPDGVCHHSHSRKQQCLHLLPILSAYFGCRVCSSAKPTEAESVHGGPPLEFERPIPQIPWRGITVVVVLVVIAATLRLGILLPLDWLRTHS